MDPDTPLRTGSVPVEDKQNLERCACTDVLEGEVGEEESYTMLGGIVHNGDGAHHHPIYHAACLQYILPHYTASHRAWHTEFTLEQGLQGGIEHETVVLHIRNSGWRRKGTGG